MLFIHATVNSCTKELLVYGSFTSVSHHPSTPFRFPSAFKIVLAFKISRVHSVHEDQRITQVLARLKIPQSLTQACKQVIATRLVSVPVHTFFYALLLRSIAAFDVRKASLLPNPALHQRVLVKWEDRLSQQHPQSRRARCSFLRPRLCPVVHSVFNTDACQTSGTTRHVLTPPEQPVILRAPMYNGVASISSSYRSLFCASAEARVIILKLFDETFGVLPGISGQGSGGSWGYPGSPAALVECASPPVFHTVQCLSTNIWTLKKFDFFLTVAKAFLKPSALKSKKLCLGICWWIPLGNERQTDRASRFEFLRLFAACKEERRWTRSHKGWDSDDESAQAGKQPESGRERGQEAGEGEDSDSNGVDNYEDNEVEDDEQGESETQTESSEDEQE
ncbi:hypothetical protein C8R45DRAFT_938794 [Mycena sanguinolenta]|nr:hypothetical protein C8R45DRAFT_938794 [Mycena sanguinolenta]